LISETQTYISVTETPDTKATAEQLERAYTRYHFALDYCRDKDVLEVACGCGHGLGYIARVAKSVLGGDIDEKNLEFARQTYRENKKIRIGLVDAQNLDFGNESFDVVILYEAIYYLAEPEEFIREAARVLRKGGRLILCSVNKEWGDFNPSPYSRKYFTAGEISAILGANGFQDICLYGGSRVDRGGLKNKAVSFLKRSAVFLHLVPKTMKGKEFLKRIFFGRLYPVPAEIREGMAKYEKPAILTVNSRSGIYKIIYAVASKK
jgi:ubiquinone/menaquinone biosynthesis C-methylase UbiE